VASIEEGGILPTAYSVSFSLSINVFYGLSPAHWHDIMILDANSISDVVTQ
jgi:hypothetical protein